MALKLGSRRVTTLNSSFQWHCSRCRRFYVTNNDPFKEHERVILESTTKDQLLPKLTKPLKEGGKIDLTGGHIEFSTIIGKRPRDVIRIRKGSAWRLSRPTLADYVLYTPRLVTPVYPADANLIVSLLDIHPPPINVRPSLPFEILEAGTGHGSLTLHLARAIHSFNTAPPVVPPVHYKTNSPPEVSPACKISDPKFSNLSQLELERYEEWRSGRRAVIHSLEVSEKHLAHAERIVHGFNAGLYSGNVNFYCGSLGPWISSKLQEKPVPFLSHAILDLPQVSEELEGVAKAMLANGTVVVFVPSITQIVKCTHAIKEKRIPLFLDDVLEIGAGAGTGGRQWNVKAVKPRALLKAEIGARLEASEEEPFDSPLVDQDEKTESDGVEEEMDRGWEMICRPKAFARVVGGGFLGIWKRTRDYT